MLLETFKTLVARFKKHTHAPPNCGSSQLLDFVPTSESIAASSGHLTQALSIPPLTGSDPASEPGFFTYSHHNVFNNSTMVSVSTNILQPQGGATMRVLDSHTIQGAEHDSSARYPPPRCHPGTRQSLRGEILHWVINRKRSWRMFYVLGPAGVGKSAVAQTVADEVDCLGASCFISRPNERDDPDRIIPTLAYQLAVRNAAYKEIISDKLAHDPAILRKTRRVQFKELLIDPFRTIMTLDISTVQNPLLIIIDGLDECKDERARCEFIELIGDHVRSFPEFPLLWLICSRPESHLKYTLSQADFQVTCRREEMSVDDEEGRQDVLLYLRGEFRDIRSKYYDSLDCDWPPDTHLLRIATAASGLFAFVSTVVRFIGDAGPGDLSSQLRVCMKALGESRTLVDQNPYVTLDLLYQHILFSVHSAIRPTTMRILGVAILYPDDGPSRSAQSLANFFLIKKAAFYHALKPLHSVLRVPSSSDASTNNVEFYHASFAEFLKDPARSGEFCLNEAAVHYDVALTGLHWHTGFGHDIQEADDIWVSPSEDAQACLESIKSKSLDVLWMVCSSVEGRNAVNMYQELHNFDVSALRGPAFSSSFGDYLNWLIQQEANSSIQMLINSLNTYADCNKINIAEVEVDEQRVFDIIAQCRGKLTKIHLDLGNGKKRLHMHIYPTDPMEELRRSVRVAFGPSGW